MVLVGDSEATTKPFSVVSSKALYLLDGLYSLAWISHLVFVTLSIQDMERVGVENGYDEVMSKPPQK